MRKIIVVLWVSIVCVGCAELLKPKLKIDIAQFKQGEYSLDIDHSTLLFKVDHLGFSKYIGRFNEFEAELNFEPENPTAATLSAKVMMASLDLANDSFEKDVKSDEWFNVEQFPEATFISSSVGKINKNALVFYGQLTFLGVTQPAAINVTFNGGANNFLTQKYTLGFYAEIQFNRSDYGLGKYVPAVGDEINIEVYGEFQKR